MIKALRKIHRKTPRTPKDLVFSTGPSGKDGIFRGAHNIIFGQEMGAWYSIDLTSAPAVNIIATGDRVADVADIRCHPYRTMQ